MQSPTLPPRVDDAWTPRTVPPVGHVITRPGHPGSLTLTRVRDHWSRLLGPTKVLTWTLECACCRDRFRFETGPRNPKLKLVCKGCYHALASGSDAVSDLLRQRSAHHREMLSGFLAQHEDEPHSFWLYEGEERLTLRGEPVTRDVLMRAHVVPTSRSPEPRRPTAADTMGFGVTSPSASASAAARSRRSRRREAPDPRDARIAALEAQLDELRRAVHNVPVSKE